MAIYAIGDVQGCFRTLTRLLEQIRFDPTSDRLWFTGDLVNRGPGSLDVLRWAYERRHRITLVLGNHDLHLLRRAAGIAAKKRLDTLDAVLAAADRERLLDWLSHQPLFHGEGATLLVHAGLDPRWSPREAQERAARVEELLACGRRGRQLRELKRGGELAETVAVLTKIRMVDRAGVPRFGYAGAPGAAPGDLVPWFDSTGRKSAKATVVFGHWSTLGLLVRPDAVALDTGCVWGQYLTAVRLDDREVFSEPYAEVGFLGSR